MNIRCSVNENKKTRCKNLASHWFQAWRSDKVLPICLMHAERTWSWPQVNIWPLT